MVGLCILDTARNRRPERRPVPHCAAFGHATARATDDAALGTLRAKYAGRIGTGAFADMFRLLTAEPVRGTSDLERAKREATLVGSLQANLKALDGTTPAR